MGQLDIIWFSKFFSKNLGKKKPNQAKRMWGASFHMDKTHPLHFQKKIPRNSLDPPNFNVNNIIMSCESKKNIDNRCTYRHVV
jgi:hypothetical protein